MLAGRFFGTMCLSEPQAGSSLADITTRAEPQADGSYRLFGNKMWISGGEHEIAENIVHLVLAKIPGRWQAAAGREGHLAVHRAEVAASTRTARSASATTSSLAGLNHKMGYRGTVNYAAQLRRGQFRPDGAAGAVG